MTHICKILLLWLLMALLPLQGIAAVVRTSCCPENTTAAASLSTAQPSQLMAAGHVHHENMAAFDMDAKPAPHHSTDHSNHHKNVSCSTCDSCCVGAFAFTPASLQFPLGAKSPLETLAPPPLLSGYIPDGLERPPRQISA